MTTREIQKPDTIVFENFTSKDSDGLAARFTIGPLEPGYGTTIGNAYRRVLLSSIPGYAIAAVRFHGVSYEYTVIPGVLEDVMTIMLNLKEVRIRRKESIEPNEEDSIGEKISISLSKKSCFKAGDISNFTSGFEIMNPDHIICNLNTNTSLDLDIIIQHGRGYVPANEVVIQAEADTLKLDAIFNPIKNVSFQVENTRVGNRTDYDKLYVDVITDKSITPEDALEHASRILIESFSFLLKNGLNDVDKGLLKTNKVTTEELSLRKLLKRPIKEFSEDLSTRSINCLEGFGLLTLGDLLNVPIETMKGIKSFGSKSQKEVQALIAKYELSLSSSKRRG